jgi:hypothetical protein
MKYSSLPVVGALSLVFILAVMAAAPQVVIADVERQDSQQGSLVVDAKPAEPAQPPPSSGDVQERALPQGVAPNLGSRTITAIPFKCSAATLKCRCYEKADCDYMRNVMGANCRDETAGCTTNCTCKISQ